MTYHCEERYYCYSCGYIHSNSENDFNCSMYPSEEEEAIKNKKTDSKDLFSVPNLKKIPFKGYSNNDYIDEDSINKRINYVKKDKNKK